MSDKIIDCLQKVMNEYIAAKRENFGSHALGNYVRKEIPKNFKGLSFFDESNYTITGSVGQGNWAFVPWIAIMNNKVTSSTQRGYYIVYLFSEDMKSVYLTIAQGVTESSKEEMIKTKEDIHRLIHPTSRIQKDDQIYLGTSSMAKKYAFSTAAYIRYGKENMPDEEQLEADLKEMIHLYEKYINIKNNKHIEYALQPQTKMVIEDKKMYMPDSDLVTHIHHYIISKGFYYTRAEVVNFYLSLRTKPFVILSGISGTGKTKMLQWFAESLGATEGNGQFALIPVRPDWNDGSDLLGYTDIKGDFIEGPLTKVIRKALDHPDFPYFVLLDEMNLARVEYYFSDILSVMESRRWEGGKIISSQLFPRNEYIRLTLPNNLYIIGTVNMDETTHPFSKKVLDRANTIEFNRVQLDYFDFLEAGDPVESLTITQDRLQSKYLYLKEVFQEHREMVEKATEVLVEINKALQLTNAQVGYRVRDEICFYLAYNEEGHLMEFEEALDHCILQKILPRIAGSDSRVDRMLRSLYTIFTNRQYDEQSPDIENAKYPRSAEKVVEMLRRLEEDGFTSFWVS